MIAQPNTIKAGKEYPWVLVSSHSQDRQSNNLDRFAILLIYKGDIAALTYLSFIGLFLRKLLSTSIKYSYVKNKYFYTIAAAIGLGAKRLYHKFQDGFLVDKFNLKDCTLLLDLYLFPILIKMRIQTSQQDVRIQVPQYATEITHLRNHGGFYVIQKILLVESLLFLSRPTK